jgi:hypothetical protein
LPAATNGSRAINIFGRSLDDCFVYIRFCVGLANMAEDAISRAGLYFDELHKIRVLDPEVAAQTNELKDECKDFLDS